MQSRVRPRAPRRRVERRRSRPRFPNPTARRRVAGLYHVYIISFVYPRYSLLSNEIVRRQNLITQRENIDGNDYRHRRNQRRRPRRHTVRAHRPSSGARRGRYGHRTGPSALLRHGTAERIAYPRPHSAGDAHERLISDAPTVTAGSGDGARSYRVPRRVLPASADRASEFAAVRQTCADDFPADGALTSTNGVTSL